jgi:hypothetical protein
MQAGKLKPWVRLMEPGGVLSVPFALGGMDLTSVARMLSDDHQEQLAWSDGKQHPLKPGKYLLAARMDLRGNNPYDPHPAVKYWLGGQITTEPVELEISDKPAMGSTIAKPLEIVPLPPGPIIPSPQ